ncbi:hypothetical protein HYW41_01155 [Candidatus Daviesbacteria bacterium]|nr:hypothetical protein [Candidatus Daviesbacteria bacterium]
MSRINRIIFVLSLIGLTVSAYLAYEYSLNSPIACPLTGSGCEVVKKSSYSKFLGIQLPYFGLVFYLVLASLSVFLSQTFNKLPRTESPRFSLKVYKKLQKTLPLYTTYPAEVCNHLSIHPRFEKTGLEWYLGCI